MTGNIAVEAAVEPNEWGRARHRILRVPPEIAVNLALTVGRRTAALVEALSDEGTDK